MKLDFPSREFDGAVAAVCHGLASDGQMRELNELLRRDFAARDEYLLRLELHSRLASEPDLFVSADERPPSPLNGERGENVLVSPPPAVTLGGITPHPHSLSPLRGEGGKQVSLRRVLALAACVALLAAGWWGSRLSQPGELKGTTSKAVAMLNRAMDVQWDQHGEAPRLGAPLEPGWLRLKSGMAQIVFYSGVRMVIEGPVDLQIVSPNEAACQSGRLIAEVPPQAKGFRVGTPQMNVTDLGTSFGLDAKERRTELHVFKGSVEFQPTAGTVKQTLNEGAGAVAESSGSARLISSNPGAFASLFDVQLRSPDAEVLRHEQWRAASSRLDEDPSLLVHFDFEQTDLADWRLPNASKRKDAAPDAAIVSCQWVEGRWADKHALEFRGVSDRVRLSVLGEYESLTLAAWVRVQGLDRQINSLFMSDGFEAGTVHWSIRDDGVLGLTAIGSEPGRYQICASPPALTLDQFGLWVHLAVVIDGGAGHVAHYLDGVAVGENALTIKPPFRIGVAELGNWNAQGFPKNDPFMIRNFSGAMDEFCLFGRALGADEVHALYSVGKPQPDPVALGR
jgi:hypothetical protein